MDPAGQADIGHQIERHGHLPAVGVNRIELGTLIIHDAEIGAGRQCDVVARIGRDFRRHGWREHRGEAGCDQRSRHAAQGTWWGLVKLMHSCCLLYVFSGCCGSNTTQNG
jgi:hypothetical protein